MFEKPPLVIKSEKLKVDNGEKFFGLTLTRA